MFINNIHLLIIILFNSVPKTDPQEFAALRGLCCIPALSCLEKNQEAAEVSKELKVLKEFKVLEEFKVSKAVPSCCSSLLAAHSELLSNSSGHPRVCGSRSRQFLPLRPPIPIPASRGAAPDLSQCQAAQESPDPAFAGLWEQFLLCK